jgi:hypothetical protein
MIQVKKYRYFKLMPGPFSLPLLGCLYMVAAKRIPIPFAAFTEMIQVKK